MSVAGDAQVVAGSFAIQGDFIAALPYGSGHINDTYAVSFDQGGTEVRYIFQRINADVFHDVPALMDNIWRTIRHLHDKLQSAGVSDVSRRAMTLIPTVDGSTYHQDANGRFWRAYIFIEKARTYDVLTSTSQAYEGARAFGHFQRMLADLPDPELHETISNFHDGPSRFEAFQAALENDVVNRAASARAEIGFIERNATIFDRLRRLKEQKAIPVRVTHNDCKMNNVMIDDATGEGVCVIDLDTVMPGLALYDFGDMVRTSTGPAAEDTVDLSQVTIEMARFDALVRGYFSSAGGLLTAAERDELVFSGKLVTLMIGTRFLTDFLCGDHYFKTHRPEHNLDRARTQFALVRSIVEQEEQMERLVRSVSEGRIKA